MTASDHLAVGAIKCMNRLGVRIPEDVSVIGFDDIDLCEIVNPTLTTIKQPKTEMGRCAAHLLLDLMQNEHVPDGKHIFEGIIVKRNSTMSHR